MAGLAALKNFINLYLTPNNELNIEVIQSLPLETVVKIQRTTQQLIDKFEMEPSSENVDMTMYLDQLYKIRNALEIYMRNNAAPVAYGGIRYKRRSKRQTNKRSKRQTNKRSKRRNKQTKRRR
jgi:hypothetical protein